jgi:Rnl2 family RNA ligase
MTDFRKYSSIENSYRGKEISRVRNEGLDKVEWVALEKVHGANFGLWPIDGKVVPSKRSGFADGSFYSCQAVVEELAPKVLELAKVSVDTVYGEIFGGGIQKGVNYGAKRFAAFDIVMGGSYVDYDIFVSLCDTHNIPRCVEIARGSFEDILAIDPAFPTRMSDCGSTDIAEGFVMKPVINTYFRLGDRVILKKKSEGFSERSSEKTPKAPKEPLTDLQKSIFEAAQAYMCDERIISAVSKFGPKEFNLVLGEVLSDIYGELERDELDCLDLSSYNSVKQEMCNLLAPMIRSIMFGAKSV